MTQQPMILTRFLCWNLEINNISFLNSSTPCLELRDSLFTAISFPSCSLPYMHKGWRLVIKSLYYIVRGYATSNRNWPYRQGQILLHRVCLWRRNCLLQLRWYQNHRWTSLPYHALLYILEECLLKSHSSQLIQRA